MFRCWTSIVVVVATAVSVVSAAEKSKEPRPEQRKASAVGASPSIASKAGSPEHVRLVFRLSNLPAVDAANAINGFLRSELDCAAPAVPMARMARSIAITAEPVSNSLIVSGTAVAVEEIRKIVSDLDKPPRTVVVEVVIGEAPASAGGDPLRIIDNLPPRMEQIARVRLATLDNQPARVQIGQRVPLFGGIDSATGGGKEYQPTTANVGLTLGVTPRVTPDNEIIVMEIEFENSKRGAEPEGRPIAAAADNATNRPRIDTMHTHTTVRVVNGRTVVLGSIAARAKSNKELFIVLTPRVL
jgi:type II secretory pathway component GspD/PulD (secretin)